LAIESVSSHISELIAKANVYPNDYGTRIRSIWLDVKEYDAVGDGTTDDSTEIQTLITAIGSYNADIFFSSETEEVPERTSTNGGTYKISADLTFPSNVNLKFASGATLSIDAGKTVTINGLIDDIKKLDELFTGAGSYVYNGETRIDAIEGSATGDVTASSAFGTDNVLVRSDGTSKGVQATGISVDDSDNVTGVAELTLTDEINLGNAKAIDMNSGEFRIYHNGSAGVIKVDDATHPIQFANQVLLKGEIKPNAETWWGHNGNKKIETTNTGIEVTGNIVVSGTVDGVDVAGEETRLANTSGTNTGDQTDATLTFTDITTNDVSTTKHGFAPKGDGTTTKFLNANGAYSTPAGSGNVSTSGSPIDNDFAKFVSATEIEGRSYAEVKTDLGLVIGTDVLAEQTIGIADNNLVEIDGATVADNDFAKFTANGLEGRSYAEVRSDINVEDGAEANNISDANATDLTDGGETTLHTHAGGSEDVTASSAFTYDNSLLRADGSGRGAQASLSYIDDSGNFSLAGEIYLDDTKAIYYGNDSDVVQYWSTTDFYTIMVTGGSWYLADYNSGGTLLGMIKATPGGSAELYYNGSKKIETTNTGVTVTGTVIADDLSVGDIEGTGDISAERFFYSGTNINSQTGTTYTLVLTDSGKWIKISNASDQTITVPLNSSVAFPIGTQIEIGMYGAGEVTVTPASGVTIRSADANDTLSTQYKVATLKKIATDEWWLVGCDS